MSHDDTGAVILAGGLARRMGGGDKCRLVVGGVSIVARTVACLDDQVTRMALNANGDLGRFSDLGLPVLPDPLPGFPGPLAGILAGLEWVAAAGLEWLVSVPGDCPFLPGDLVARLHEARAEAGAMFACAASGGWTHPVVGLWPASCRAELWDALARGERKIDAFTELERTAAADWLCDPFDPFLNVNSPDDLARANECAVLATQPC